MKTDKIDIRKAFDEVFGTEDKYFGEWFLEAEDSLTHFLESGLKDKELFFKRLRYLYLYLESIEVLKDQAEAEDFKLARLFSRDIWYCSVLLLLVGLIDQYTKKELDNEGKLKRLKDRFQIVLNCLDEDKKRDFLLHYNGSRFKSFDDLTSHLYETRTFFAHDVVMPEGSVPQDAYFGIHQTKTGTLFINMPHGRIFLLIVIALTRYLGFKGKMEIISNKKFDSITDFFRKT